MTNTEPTKKRLSVRLTHGARDSILNKIMVHAFKEKDKDVSLKLNELANKIYNIIVDEKTRALFETVPVHFIRTSETMYLRDILPNANYYDSAVSFDNRPYQEQESHIKHRFFSQDCLRFLTEKEIKEIAPLVDEYRELSASHKESKEIKRKQIRGILYSASTNLQLIEMWKDIESFVDDVCGNGIKIEKKTNQIANLEVLNASLNLPPEEKAA